MLVAGKRANALNIPVVLDPVGAGASSLRNETLRTLMQEVRFAVIKGNSSEIRFLAGDKATARGVDADEGTLVSENNLAASARMYSIHTIKLLFTLRTEQHSIRLSTA